MKSRKWLAGVLGGVVGSAAMLTAPADVVKRGHSASVSVVGNAKVAASTKLKSVGMTVMTLNNPYFVAFKNALDADAKKYGFTAITESADFDLAKQQSQVEDFIQKRVSVIFLNAVDSHGIAGAVKEAVAAHIPVIAVDVGADGGVTATITSDNYQAGKLAAEYLVHRLHGKGNVVLINGTPITSVFDRVHGFKDVLKKYPKIKIVAEQNGQAQRDASYTVFQNILTAHPKGTIDAVFGINDPSSIGAYLAAKAAGRNDFFIVSVDGSKAACDLIKQGTIFAETSAQHPSAEIDKAVQLAQEYLNGKKIPKLTLIPVNAITRANVNSYKPWG